MNKNIYHLQNQIKSHLISSSKQKLISNIFLFIIFFFLNFLHHLLFYSIKAKLSKMLESHKSFSTQRKSS